MTIYALNRVTKEIVKVGHKIEECFFINKDLAVKAFDLCVKSIQQPITILKRDSDLPYCYAKINGAETTIWISSVNVVENENEFTTRNCSNN